MALLKAIKAGTGECLWGRVEVARTFSKRLIGLLDRPALMAGQGLYFPDCKSIHTVFMRFAIDILFLDRELKIVKMARCLRPYRMAFGPWRTRGTLELACGTVEQHTLKVGDRIQLVETTDRVADVLV
jgi:uncharacterized membrane protein (UPF0127 family)